MSAPDRSSDPRRKANAVRQLEPGEFATDYDKETGTMMSKRQLQERDGWVSAHPYGSPGHTTYVSPEQQAKNMEPEEAYVPEYKTDFDKKTGTMMSKRELKERDGWVSPWPYGHPNHTTYVSPEEETENSKKGNN